MQKMRDNENDKLLIVRDAIEQETGQHISHATAYRWTTQGIDGVVLESLVLGGRRYSTRRWVAAFITAGTAKAGVAK